MPIWKTAIKYFSASGEPRLSCEVRISDGTIAVSWIGDEGPETWSGTEIAPGHFELKGSNGTAELHRSPNSDILVGSWVADNQEGLCRIELTE
jgi:hypothetical protein